MESEPTAGFWTTASIERLAEHLNLPARPDMQDWPFEVADPIRIDEFMTAFEQFEDEPDIRYTLMDVLIQSFEELGDDLGRNDKWRTLLTWIQLDYKTHAHQVWYWSAFQENALRDAWRVSPFFREIWERNKIAS